MRQQIPDSPELKHLGWCSQGNPDVRVHGRKTAADQDVVLAEVFDDLLRRTVGVQHHEIRVGVDGLQHPGMALVVELLPVIAVPPDEFLDRFLVVERRHRCPGHYGPG